MVCGVNLAGAEEFQFAQRPAFGVAGITFGPSRSGTNWNSLTLEPVAIGFSRCTLFIGREVKCLNIRVGDDTRLDYVEHIANLFPGVSILANELDAILCKIRLRAAYRRHNDRTEGCQLAILVQSNRVVLGSTHPDERLKHTGCEIIVQDIKLTVLKVDCAGVL
ncbi:hypothetical protein ES703_89355 [subsurface metagenome]